MRTYTRPSSKTISSLSAPNYSFDVLKGIAITFIVLLHASMDLQTRHTYTLMSGLFKTDHGAVDLFFVMSGFILMLNNYRHMGKINKVFPYMLKRFIRIFPVYWICLFIVLIIYKVWNPAIAKSYAYDIPFFINNIFLLKEPWLISPAWFISIEIYLYILFVVVFVFKRVKNLLIFFGIYSGAILGIQIVFKSQPLLLIVERYFGIYTLEFILGILSALLYIYGRDAISFRRWLASGIVSWIAGSFFVYHMGTNISSFQNMRFAYYGVPFSILLIGVVGVKNHGSTLVNKIFHKLGQASYSIYLLNMIMLQGLFVKSQRVMREYGNGVSFFLEVCVVIFLSLVIPTLFYEVIEKRMLTYMKNKLLPAH
jgi:exopolysaccharide production protein ExoZ